MEVPLRVCSSTASLMTFLLLLVTVCLHEALSSGASSASRHSDAVKQLILNYDGGRSGEPRAGTACNVTSSSAAVVGRCSLSCVCSGGRWQCCRLRKSYDRLTRAERRRYADAFLAASRDPRFRPLMAELMWSHASISCDKFAGKRHVNRQLMVYHRILTLALENLLRRIDCHVTVPYWDVTMRRGPWSEQRPFKDDRDIFGGNGVPPDYCVQNGKFSESEFQVPKFHYKGHEFPYRGCLRRHFNDKYPPFSWKAIQVALSAPADQAELVDIAFLQGLDLTAHSGIGGSWDNIGVGADPLFLPFHSYLDKLYANFQLRGPEFMTGNGFWNVSGPLMNFPWLTAADGIDFRELPSGVCVQWGEALPREQALRTGHYAALEVPREDHLYLPYARLRELRLEKNDVAIFKLILYFLRFHFRTFRYNEAGFHADNLTDYTHTKLPFQAAIRNRCEPLFAIDPGFRDFNTSGRVEELIGGGVGTTGD